MTDKALQHRIVQLEAENAALKAAQGAVQGPLHPDVQPAFHNGSIVLHAGTPHRVIGRSIDWDGNTTYDLSLVHGDVVHVTPDKRVERFDLADDAARMALPGIRTYDLRTDEDRVFSVPEADIDAFHEHDTHAYAVTTEATKHAAQRGGEQVTVDEGADIARE